jgi:hypothetical protein
LSVVDRRGCGGCGSGGVGGCGSGGVGGRGKSLSREYQNVLPLLPDVETIAMQSRDLLAQGLSALILGTNTLCFICDGRSPFKGRGMQGSRLLLLSSYPYTALSHHSI